MSHPYRRIAAMLLLAALLAVTFFAGVAVGITFASAPRSALQQPHTAATADGPATLTGAPSAGRYPIRPEVRESAVGQHRYPDLVLGGVPSLRAVPSVRTPAAASQQPSASAVSVRETPDPGTTAPPPSAWMREGIASTYGPGYDGLTASPDWPRGSVIEICGPGGCETRTVNDFGPDQRLFPDRVVDLDVATFEAVCAVGWRMGLCPVTVTLVRRG